MKILKNKKLVTSLVALFFLVVPIGLFAAGDSTVTDTIGTGIGAAVSVVVGFIALIITSVLGLISTLLINMIVSVAQYSDIINVPVVQTGWVIVRDLCNMFFVLIFLVIAFATILRVESYNFKKMLPKLLMYAVLINFSRTIFGLIIDASTIIMLTFVSGFANTPGEVVGLMKMDQVLSITKNELDTSNGFGTWTVAIGIIAGVIASVMTVVVLSVILAVLAMRIVMLWIYTVLSPLAFLGFGFDPIKKFTQEIWDDFIKTIIVGPVLAFFIYLAFKVDSSVSILTGAGRAASDVCAGPTTLFCSDNFQKYIIVIAMLMGGLKISQKIGGEVSKIAGKTENWTKGKIKSAGNKSGAAAWGGVKTGGGIAMGGLKAADATWNKGRGASVVGVVQDRYKSVAKGAVAGGAVGSIGGFGGAALGGLIGGVSGAFSKNVGDHFDNKRKLREAQGKISDKDDGSWYTHNGHDYKADNNRKFRRFDKTANNGAGDFVSDESLKIGGKDLVNDRTEDQKKFSAHYRAATNKGKASREVAEKEGVDKVMKNYNGISPDDLKRLFDTETDKKSLKALAMLLKGKFKDGEHDRVNKAKDLLSGNELMNKDFSEAMMKNNAYLYHSRSAEDVDDKGLAKAYSEGKFKLDDQDLSNINAAAMKKFAEIIPTEKFEKAASSWQKVAADADKFKNIFNDGLKDGIISGFEGADLALRKVHHRVTGDIQDSAKEADGAGGVRINEMELQKLVDGASVKDYKNWSDKALEDPMVKRAVKTSLNANGGGMMTKVRKSNDISKERTDVYERIIA